MKPIETYEPQYKLVGKLKITKYQTDDGIIHNTKKQAELWEKELDKAKELAAIKTITLDLDFMEIATTWYYASTERELSLIIERVGGLKSNRYDILKVYGTPKVGEWIGYHTEDGGDSADRRYVYVLSYILDRVKEVQSKIYKVLLIKGKNK